MFQSESTLCSCLNVKELLARSRPKIWSLSDCNWTWTQNHLVCKEHPTTRPNRLNDWAVFWVLTVWFIWLYVLVMSRTHFRVNAHYSCLNVKELHARSRPKIWTLSDCNWTWTQNHLVHKQTTNYPAKLAQWLSCVPSTYLYGVFDCMFLPYHVRILEWIHIIVSWMSRNCLLELNNIQSIAPYR